MTITEARMIALSFPETTEEPHFEKTSFRVNKKILATYDGGHNLLCIKLSLIDQDVFCAYDKSIIYPVSNKWGKQGWTFITLEKVKEEMLQDAMNCAYCSVAPKKLAALVKGGIMTNKYIALLRGINVSGQKKILMKDLKVLSENIGFGEVQTYIQSGNIVFTCPRTNTTKLAQKIKTAITDAYGFDVEVFVITPTDLKELIAQNPWHQDANVVVDKSYVALLSAIPDESLYSKLQAIDHGDEIFECVGTNLYFYVPKGIGQSKINNNYFEAKLKLKATTRNWNTMNTLLEMVK